MFRTGILAAAILGVFTVSVTAAGVIEQRQQIMKGLGKATKPVGAMLKGEESFDIAKVHEALKAYSEAAQKMPGLFPEDSRTGNETTAAPKIWDDPQGFRKGFAKLDADSKAALAEINDEASFKAKFPTVLKNCGDCHEGYRIKKG